MPKKKQAALVEEPTSSEGYTKRIIKLLKEVEALSGRRPRLVFEDWLQLADIATQMLPAHLESILKTGWVAKDGPDVQVLWSQIQARYGTKDEAADGVWQCFVEAFALLFEAVQGGLWPPWGSPDILGDVYMTYAASDREWKAQYFTHWNLAVFKAAAMLAGRDGIALIQRNLRAACFHPKNIPARAIMFGGLLSGVGSVDGTATDFLINHLIPAALPFYEPVAVIDPSVGSGILLLAAASMFPAWAVKLGLIQFYGIDIDRVCTLMCKINCRLYGLNGYHIELAQALGARPEASPEPSWPVWGIKNKGHGPVILSPDHPTYEEVFRSQKGANQNDLHKEEDVDG